MTKSWVEQYKDKQLFHLKCSKQGVYKNRVKSNWKIFKIPTHLFPLNKENQSGIIKNIYFCSAIPCPVFPYILEKYLVHYYYYFCCIIFQLNFEKYFIVYQLFCVQYCYCIQFELILN